ncbi:hypothetical protein BDW72DRAFT_195108 [Aspergillus terricola var. indicus]
MTTNIPIIHLLCMEEKYTNALNNVLTTVDPEKATFSTSATDPAPVSIFMHNTSLSSLPQTSNFDLIVSPANSYGRLDGGFDDAISRAFCRPPENAYDTLTKAAQAALYAKWRGFAPPGTCTLVPFPQELLKADGSGDNKWGCKWVAICPTMRTPDDVRWDREVVYECVWSLLCAVEGWNRDVDENQTGEQRIRSILITPMATGCGKVSPERWAAQFVLAIKHFVDAIENPGRWRSLGWKEIYDDTLAVQRTWKVYGDNES